MNEIKANKIHYLMLYCSASPTHKNNNNKKTQTNEENKKWTITKKTNKKKAIKVCAFYYFKMVCVWRIDEHHSRSVSSLLYPQGSKVLPGFDQWYYQTLACRQRLLCSWGRKCYWMICKRKSDISMRHLIETFYKWVET